MITHFLSREQVAAYCKDFAKRLEELQQDTPLVWCPIGFSGREIAKVVLPFLSQGLQQKIRIQPLTYHKPTHGQPGMVSIVPKNGQTEEQAREALRQALADSPSALVLDSSVHSGSSMLGAVHFLSDLGAQNSLAYSLVIKQSSGFIPHYFGLVVGDHDRALFLLDAIPNNRLAKPKSVLKGFLRKLTEDDVQRADKLDTGVASISKIGWGDLWYDARAHGYQVYVAEVNGVLAGFVKYKLEPTRRLMLDVIAVDRQTQGRGVGAALFRWAETTARSNSCLSIDLWGIENEVENYEKAGYKGSGCWIDTGGGEKYQHMAKPLLYHFDLKEMSER